MRQVEQMEGEAFRRAAIFNQITDERCRQDSKWGGAAHDDSHTTEEFVQLIEGYAGWARTMAGMGSQEKARHRLIQVAALAVAACETIDRKLGKESRHAAAAPWIA